MKRDLLLVGRDHSILEDCAVSFLDGFATTVVAPTEDVAGRTAIGVREGFPAIAVFLDRDDDLSTLPALSDGTARVVSLDWDTTAESWLPRPQAIGRGFTAQVTSLIILAYTNGSRSACSSLRRVPQLSQSLSTNRRQLSTAAR